MQFILSKLWHFQFVQQRFKCGAMQNVSLTSKKERNSFILVIWYRSYQLLKLFIFSQLFSNFILFSSDFFCISWTELLNIWSRVSVEILTMLVLYRLLGTVLAATWLLMGSLLSVEVQIVVWWCMIINGHGWYGVCRCQT